VTAAGGAGLYDPWAVTDGGYRFASIEERFGEGYGFGLETQLVRIEDASGEKEGVEVVGAGFIERHVDREILAPIGVLPGSDFVFLWRYDAGFGARFVESFPWFHHLDFFETVGD
jgi:hypothetical protein